MGELKTGYQWCLEAMIRILDLNNWDTDWSFYEESYHTEKISKTEFHRRLEMCKTKPNSLPRKSEMFLEYRMYGLVPYNLSPIQQGIQFGHAVVDYARNIRDTPPSEAIYNKWADKDKTFIILNGGTTNNNPERLGSLNSYMQSFIDNGIRVQPFYEPDLGDQLTAFVFLVDERVWKKDLYEDFVGTPFTWPPKVKPSQKEYDKWEQSNDRNYRLWVEKIGGEKNVFLRNILKTLKLA